MNEKIRIKNEARSKREEYYKRMCVRFNLMNNKQKAEACLKVASQYPDGHIEKAKIINQARQLLGELNESPNN